MSIQLTVNVKMCSRKRIKEAGERLTRGLIACGYKGDIECIGMLQAMLDATGADPVAIQHEMEATMPDGRDISSADARAIADRELPPELDWDTEHSYSEKVKDLKEQLRVSRELRKGQDIDILLLHGKVEKLREAIQFALSDGWSSCSHLGGCLDEQKRPIRKPEDMCGHCACIAVYEATK